MSPKTAEVRIPKKSFLKLKKAIDEVAERIMIKERIKKSEKSFKEGNYKTHEEIKKKFDIQ